MVYSYKNNIPAGSCSSDWEHLRAGRRFGGRLLRVGSGWAALIKNICRSTLLSAFASLIDWEGCLAPPFPGSRDPRDGFVRTLDSPYNRGLSLLLPGIYPVEGTSRKRPWWRRGRAELS